MKKTDKKTLDATLSGLFHDIGKIDYRYVDKAADSTICGCNFLKSLDKYPDIFDCIKYSNKNKLTNADLPSDSLAYAVYIADLISSARDTENDNCDEYDKMSPLTSVFATMQGNEKQSGYKACTFDVDKTVYPQNIKNIKNSPEDYKKISEGLQEKLKDIKFTDDYVDYILSALEEYTSYIPSTTSKQELNDISLFDHLKLTGALASCITEYCISQGIDDLHNELFVESNKFLNKKAFIMYSCDISGIQNFIYNISTSYALKSLRSRSFVLELLMEHYIDEIIDGCGVTRANLIYCGGGHCYIILPNTQKAVDCCNTLDNVMKNYFIDNFGISLYIASGKVECSGNDLLNVPAYNAPYPEIFKELSRKIGIKKLHRYSANEIIKLNSSDTGGADRECIICGGSNNLNSNNYCPMCDMFIKIGGMITSPEFQVIVFKDKSDLKNVVSWEIPALNGKAYMNFYKSQVDSYKDLKDLEISNKSYRVYVKNRNYTYRKCSRNIYIADYCFDGNLSKLIDSMSSDEKGIKRISILRADVDNLGKAFICGFEKEETDLEKRYRNVSISRVATFSRQMTIFFKLFINNLLSCKNNINNNLLSENSNKQVNIVYSGGDDIFLVGLWSDIIDSALIIRNAFKHYCNDALTFSAGIGIFTSKYPIAVSALSTAELEDNAKTYISGNGQKKNAVNLFAAKDTYLFSWNDFENKVVGEKYKQIKELMDYKNTDSQEQLRGNSFLYKLFELLCSTDDKINIARYAYILARMKHSSNDKEYQRIYSCFSDNMYRWIFSKDDRKELMTAINIYVYMNRKRDK